MTDKMPDKLDVYLMAFDGGHLLSFDKPNQSPPAMHARYIRADKDPSDPQVREAMRYLHLFDEVIKDRCNPQVWEAVETLIRASSKPDHATSLTRIKSFLRMRYGRDLGDVHEDMAFLVEQLEQSAPSWQPISTAPRDEVILVYQAAIRNEGNHIYTAWYNYSDEQWDCGDCYIEPTHWMPLPKPPTEKE